MAGGFDGWRVGGKSRGTRSQFRLEGLQPFKCTYPVHLTDMMDQSTQAGLQKIDFATSPFKETRTRAVREYEQTIDQLRKENFDLKLKIFLMKENRKKYQVTDDCIDETDGTVQIIVDLRIETENLRKELYDKDQELQIALEQAEKFSSELKEMQGKLMEQQEMLSLIEQLPTTEEFTEIKDQYSELVRHNEHLNELLSEKNKEIEETTMKLKGLEDDNKKLEEKVRKRNEAIKGCAKKYHEDVDSIPSEVRTLMKAAVKAAKSSDDSQMVAAVENLKASLCQIMPEPSDVFGIGLDDTKCLGGSHVEGSSQVHSETANSSNQHKSSSSFKSVDLNEDLLEQSLKEELEQLGNTEFADNLSKILHTNEQLSEEAEHNLKVINDLLKTVQILDSEKAELQKEKDEIFKKWRETYEKLKLIELEQAKYMDIDALSKGDSAVQTDIQWQMIQSKINDKNMQEFGISDDIEDLKEEILMLVLAVDQKDKELLDINQKLVSLEDNVKNDFNKKDEVLFEDFSTERGELQRRLAISCSVNNELLRHLQSLERFMEDLLNQKNVSTSSLDTVDETNGFFSQLSKCLDESLKLSHVLSDQLSICEGSKIFEASDVTVNRDDFINEMKSYENLESLFSQNESDILSNNQEGMNNFFPFNREFNANRMGTGKRRLPFSSVQKSAEESIVADSDNVVVLKTSNNEDLILLLNDRGDPEDVLIRNNHSLLDKDADENRRRCWDTSMNRSSLSSEKFNLAHFKENIYNVDQTQPFKPSFVRYNTWMSSDSDTWSEPDRNVSLQRIGIDIQTSPITSKSPRKSRLKDRRMAEDSTKNESTSSYAKFQPWSKRRRCSETSRISFVCKKCQKYSQHSDDLIKEENSNNNLQEIQDLYSKNMIQQKELLNLYEDLKEKKMLIESLDEEKKDLINQLNNLKETAKELRESNELLSAKNEEYLMQISEKDSKNSELSSIINDLENKLSYSDDFCDQLQSELQQTKERLVILDKKCSEYEEKLAIDLKFKEEKHAEIEALKEKEKELLADNQNLSSLKDSLLDNLKAEQEQRTFVESKNLELVEKLETCDKEISILQTNNKELEDRKLTLSEEKAASEAKLETAKMQCEQLNSKVTSLEENLNTLKSKCESFETKVLSLTDSKRNFYHNLLNFETNFLNNLKMFNALFDVDFELEGVEGKYLNEENEEQIAELAEKLHVENETFKEIVIKFSKQLADLQIALQQNKLIAYEEKNKTSIFEQQLKEKEDKIRSLHENIDWLQNEKASVERRFEESILQRRSSGLLKLENKVQEIETLNEQIFQQSKTIEVLQNQIEEYKQSLESINLNYLSAQEQLTSVEKTVEKENVLLDAKDKEIAVLQNRIYNMQSQINVLLSEKITSNRVSPLKSSTSVIEEPVSPDSSCIMQECPDSISHSDAKAKNLSNSMQVSSDSVLPSATNTRDLSNNSSISVQSDKIELSSSKVVSRKDLDKYIKIIRTLQTKLEMYEKRIEMLEKEKATLREHVLAHVQGSNTATASKENVSLKNAELESKLETKQSFIRELKSDLYKAHDSLIDKQKENDKLQRELIKYKKLVDENSKTTRQNIPSNRFSDTFLRSTETNIIDLRKQKHELIKSLLNLQKEFYETKNIHLRHFEKFNSHIESLRSLQLSPYLFKSESAPLLNSSLPLDLESSRKWDITLKNTQIDLEVDIEYLQNFKIFLKRFFTPIMLQSSESSQFKCAKDCECISPETPKKETAVQANLSEFKPKISGSHKLFETLDSVEQLRVADVSSQNRLTTTASVISYKLDWIENVLKGVVEEFRYVNEADHSPNDSTRQTAAKSILLKLFEGLNSLKENADEVFYLNSALKSLELFNTHQSLSKNDISDRESLLSEETIALSRSESLSPVSFDEQFPSSSVPSRLKEKDPSFTRSFEGNKREPLRLSHKLLSSSQDSVFQRSHYSSPDLGIESDPNHEHSAPEQADNYQPVKHARHDPSITSTVHKNLGKLNSSSVYNFSYSSLKLDDDLPLTIGDTLHAIGILQEYELLKKEVAESLIGIKSVLSRTGDGLQHIASYTSPRKKLEFGTFKAIKDTCMNIEVCLQKAHKLVQNFWVAPCPSEEELKIFLKHNEELNAKLKRLYESKKKQEKDFKDVLEKLKQAEIIKEQQERKISRKLVKTKKVLRLAEKKILETKNIELPMLNKRSSNMPIL